MSKRQAVKPLSGCGTSTVISHQMTNWRSSKSQVSLFYYMSQGHCSKEAALSLRQDLASVSWKHCPIAVLYIFKHANLVLPLSTWLTLKSRWNSRHLESLLKLEKSCRHQTEPSLLFLVMKVIDALIKIIPFILLGDLRSLMPPQMLYFISDLSC